MEDKQAPYAAARWTATPSCAARSVPAQHQDQRRHHPGDRREQEARLGPRAVSERARAAAPSEAPIAVAVASHEKASVTVPSGAARSTIA